MIRPFICIGYKSPQSNWASIKYNFETIVTVTFNVKNKVMVKGDFKADFLKCKNSDKQQNYLPLKKFRLKNCINESEFSTDLKTEIDITFVNFDISYHKRYYWNFLCQKETKGQK